MKRRLIPALAVFQILLISNAFPKSLAQIDFYGIASKDTEKNMLSMTEDIFFAQLKELEYTINDRRSENFSEDFFSGNADFSQSEKPDTGIFYAVISKIDAAEWKMELVLKTQGHKEPETENKIYNSYYKILMESKTSLRGIVENLAKTSGEENKTENNGAGSLRRFTFFNAEPLNVWIPHEILVTPHEAKVSRKSFEISSGFASTVISSGSFRSPEKTSFIILKSCSSVKMDGVPPPI